MNKTKESDFTTKELFFNNIAHEFRTPLSLILSPIEQLLNEVENPVHVQKMKMISRNAIYLKQLIDQLLAIAKIEGGQTDVNLQKVKANQFFRELLEPFSALAEIKSVNYCYEFLQLDQEIWIDTLKTKIILSNLVSNAIKFTSEKGLVEVRVCIENGIFKFRVSDTGIGIAKDKIPHVFDRFYQEDRHIKHYIGTGIGLSLCKELSNQIKAKLYVESIAGEGSTFFFELPVYAHDGDAKKYYPDAVLNESVFVHKDAPDHIQVDKTYEIDEETDVPVILVVEDNAEIRSLLVEAIKEYKVLEASNGQEGLELAMKYLPRIVVSDLMMPDMDGFELIEMLRGDMKTSHIPVVVVSALNEVQHRLDAFQKGASAFLPKPFNLQEVKLQVDNLLQLQQKEEKSRSENFMTLENELNDLEKRFVRELNEAIEDNISEEHFGVESLSQILGMSRVQLHRKAKATCGCSASSYLKRYKMGVACDWLIKKNISISDISFKLGYASVAHFSRIFKEVYNYSPRQYKALSEEK